MLPRNVNRDLFHALIFLVAFILVVAVIEVFSVRAHSWYPPECCNDKDCAEVITSTEMPNGDIEVTTKIGKALIPKNFPRKPSEDNKEHACLLPAYHEGWGHERVPPTSKYDHFVVCYFVPMGS